MPRSASSSQASSPDRHTNALPPPLRRGTRWLCPYCIKAITRKICKGSKNAANAGRAFVLCFGKGCPYEGPPEKKNYFFWLDDIPAPAAVPLVPPQPAAPPALPQPAAFPFTFVPPAVLPVDTSNADLPVLRCIYPGCISTRVNRDCRRRTCLKHCKADGGCLGIKSHVGANPIADFIAAPPPVTQGVHQAAAVMNPPTHTEPVSSRHITPPFDNPSPPSPPIASGSSAPARTTRQDPSSSTSGGLLPVPPPPKKKSFAKSLDQEWALAAQNAERDDKERLPVSNHATQTHLWLYHQNDFPVECFLIDVTKQEFNAGLRISNVATLVQFLNVSLGPEEFAPATSLVRIYNLVKQRWEMVSFSLAINVRSKEYNPLIVSLLRCTEYPKLDDILLEAKQKRVGIYGTNKIQPAVRRMSTPLASPLPSSKARTLVTSPTPSPTYPATQLPPYSTQPQSAQVQAAKPSRDKWFQNIHLLRLIDLFGELGVRRGDGDITARGTALFGPDFRKSTWYNLRDYWAETSASRKEQYRELATRQGKSYTWKVFKAVEAGHRKEFPTVKVEDEDGGGLVAGKGKGREVFIDLTGDDDFDVATD